MTLYLDYQATTPLAPEVTEAMRPWMAEKFANPHATHRLGREAAAAIAVAREAVAALLPKDGKVYFTSGATEALNWALRCVRIGEPRRLACPNSEHAAVRDTVQWLGQSGAITHLLPVGTDGLIARLSPPPGISMMAAMLVNNEIGVIQPIAALAQAAHEAGALFLCDAVQGFGRIAIPEGPDLIAVTAHKIHGPKGVGALWVRDGIEIDPLIHGGGQEGGLRSGTLSPMLCAGFGAAASLAAAQMHRDARHVGQLWDAALEMIPPGWIINGSTEARYRGNLNLRHDGLDVARLMSDVRQVAFSAGSACASGSGRPSHVLRAIGLSDAQARSSIRIGFGRYTGLGDLQEALSLIFTAAHRQLGQTP